jgi:LEA14-like dessication related protein
MSAGMSAGMRCVAGLAAAALLGSCALTPRFTPPRLSIADVQLEGGDLWEQRLRVRVHVENPNTRPLPVKALEYTLEVAGQPLARGASAASFIVPAMGESDFDTNVTTNLAGTLLTLLGRGPEGLGQSVEYRLTGKVSLSEGLMRSIPFDERGSFRLQ